MSEVVSDISRRVIYKGLCLFHESREWRNFSKVVERMRRVKVNKVLDHGGALLHDAEFYASRGFRVLHESGGSIPVPDAEHRGTRLG